MVKANDTDLAGGDQPGEAGLRQLRDPGAEAGRRPRSTDAQGPAARSKSSAPGSDKPLAAGPHRVPRQRGRPDHRHDQGCAPSSTTATRRSGPASSSTCGVKLYDQDDAIVVPSRAVQTGPSGQFVLRGQGRHDAWRSARWSVDAHARATPPCSRGGTSPRATRWWCAARCALRPARRSRVARQARRSREPVGDLHPASGHDHPGHGRHPDLRHRRLTGCCRSASCPTSTSRRSRSPPSCRARARTPWPPRSPRRWRSSSRPSPASTR